jgi:hypothetical protein
MRIKGTVKTTFLLTMYEDIFEKEDTKGMTRLEAMFFDERNVIPEEFFWFQDELPFGTTIQVTMKTLSGIAKTTCFRLKLYKDDYVRKKLEVLFKLEAMFDDYRNELPEEYFWFADDIPFGTTIEVTFEVV